ncbi:hypothetical protein WT27_09935 [Burkholderia territorii]|uniref:Uncharacterized protein n=1 Tax=Burkholderia territorii TaxID=1503055 RepID=A0A105V8U1_9BURK|nr:hypothetical protein [Burkholderia territorii]KVV43472.1 hypothetical protein WT27_09935 [Burkholderia territorii]KVX43931.1 hypothetical protein WT31_26360 [Burkholderia territorii]
MSIHTEGWAIIGSAGAALASIADKRQKWIDDLRDDVSLYVALTKEILAGDLRRNSVTNQAVSLASILSESSQARRTVAGGW